MSDSKDKDKADNLGFSWGKKKGVGGRNAKIKVQFYESFTYDGDEYCIGDSIYLFKEGEPEPYIGKLIKIWDSTSNKSRKVKVLWFFKPSEISNYLEGVNVLENELFLACGEGVGLTNINPLGKRNWFTAGKHEDLMKSAREQGTLVLLQNLDPTYTSSEVEDIVWHGFGESCTAKMVPHTATCSPHSGEAFVIFKTRVAAERVVNKLDQECLMLPNERPLVGSIWVASFDEQSSFPGHLVIDKLKHQLQREAKAVSTSHCAQPNTLEYEMAIEWRLLQERADLWWRKLFKQQGGELKKLTASFKSKRT